MHNGQKLNWTKGKRLWVYQGKLGKRSFTLGGGKSFSNKVIVYIFRRFAACLLCPSVRDSSAWDVDWLLPLVFRSNLRNRTTFSVNKFTRAIPRLAPWFPAAAAFASLLDSPALPELYALVFLGGILSDFDYELLTSRTFCHCKTETLTIKDLTLLQILILLLVFTSSRIYIDEFWLISSEINVFIWICECVI